MAILGKEDYFKRVNEIVGADTSDTAISFVEDMTDTYNALIADANSDDWKSKFLEMEQKLKENDEAWRTKYISRFMRGDSNAPATGEPNEETAVDVSEGSENFDDLFEGVE